MNIEIVKSKIHRVKVTGANLDYIGSITIDKDLMNAANIIEGVKDTKLINWKPIIPQTPLKADSIHEIHIDKKFKEKKYTHVRLNIFPDGGVSRLRVYGFI